MSDNGREEFRLGDLVTLKRGYDLPEAKRTAGIYPIVSSSGISGSHNEYKVKGPGVVTGRYGTLGEVFYIQGRFWPLNTSLYVRDFKGNNPRFISYYLRTILSENFNAAGAVPGVNRNVLHKLAIPKPPREQREIAAILSAYDELIENNQRRITLLEKTAEEIYREWFVRLRFPGHEQVNFVKAVPEGWEVKRFHEIVEYYIGGGWGEDDQSTSFSDGAFVIRGTDIPDVQSGSFEGCPFRFHKPSNLKSRRLQPHDFVFEVSGGSTNQLLGRNVLVTERMLNFLKEPVIPASFCKLIRFKQKLVSPYFMKYFLKLYYDYDLVGIYQIQSTGISNYQFESFLKYQTIIIPSSELQKAFENKVKPLIEMRDAVSIANIALKKTRDMLLPRLISGKLSVKNLDLQFPPGMIAEVETADA